MLSSSLSNGNTNGAMDDLSMTNVDDNNDNDGDDDDTTTMRKGDDRTTKQPTHDNKIDHQRGRGDGGGSRDDSNDFEDNKDAREQTAVSWVEVE